MSSRVPQGSGSSWTRWSLIRFVALLLVCAASALAGAYLMVRSFSSEVAPFTLGTVRVSAVPAREGRVDLYVPIVDWGVRASPFDAPVALELRFRSLDRDEALAVLGSREVAEARLPTIRSELAGIGRDAVRRSMLLGIAGGIGGGLLAGGLIGVLFYQRRWLAYGAVVGAIIPLAYGGVVLTKLRPLDYAAFEQPTFYAQGGELPSLLSVSEELVTAGEVYTESYEQALAGLANLVASASEGRALETPTMSVVLASDLHANTLVLPVLEDYTREKVVFWAGDFTLRGTAPETRLVPLISRLGRTAVAVSGNHDSPQFMRELARAGVIVLTREGRLLPDGSTDGHPVAEIEGLEVAGYDDPLEGSTGMDAPLDLTEAQFEEEARELIAWFEALPQRPALLLVHQHGLAHELLEALGEANGPPLLILTGHDHEQHLEESEAGVLVDGGSAGAGGPLEIGDQAAGFAVIHFAAGTDPQAVDLIEVEPLTGNARATRTVLGGVQD